MIDLVKNTFKDKTFLKTFFSIAFPVMIQSLLSFIVSFVDTFMISAVSNEAVSAVYAVNQAGYIFLIASFGAISGAAIFVQQFNGAKDYKHVRQCFRYKWVVMLLLLAIMIPLYYIFGKDLVWFYCKSDKNNQLIYELGQEYLKIIIISYAIAAISTIYSDTLREMGKTKIPLFANAVSLVTNIVCNAIMIYLVANKQPLASVKGIAWATIIARVVELVLLVVICKTRKFEFDQRVFTHFRIEKDLLKTLIRKSIPLFFNELFWSSGQVLMTMALSQRNGVLSALSIVSTMSNIFSIIFSGLAIGIGVMVGNTLGSGDLEKAQDNNKKLYVVGLSISLITGILMMICSPFIPMLFAKVDSTQKALASKLILIYGSLLWAFCLCTCFYNTLKSGGMALHTFLLDFIAMWCFTIPIAWILSTLTNIDMVWLYLVVQSTDMIKAFIGFLFVKQKKWVQNLTLLK